jgi:hypothetical protein
MRLRSTLCSEFIFNQPVQMPGNRGLIKALNDFVEKTGDDETLGNWNRNSARAQVKQLVFFDLAGGGAVGATDVVSEDFQAGH